MLKNSFFNTFTGCVSISTFTSLIGTLFRNYKFCSWIKNLLIPAEIKNHNPIVNKKHDKIVFLAKIKLNKIEVLILKALITHDEFVSINNLLKEYD